jgi:hypothetical protein
MCAPRELRRSLLKRKTPGQSRSSDAGLRDEDRLIPCAARWNLNHAADFLSRPITASGLPSTVAGVRSREARRRHYAPMETRRCHADAAIQSLPKILLRNPALERSRSA